MATDREIALMRAILGQKFINQPNYQTAALPVNPGAGSDFARYMGAHTSGPINAAGAALLNNGVTQNQAAKTEKPSFINRFFDTLGIPGRVVENTAQGIADSIQHPHGGFLSNVGHEFETAGKAVVGGVAGLASATVGNLPGLSGSVKKELDHVSNSWNPHISGQQILNKDFGVKNKLARYGGGFALDMVTDPLSYLGPGEVKAGYKVIKGLVNHGDQAVKAAHEAYDAASASAKLDMKASNTAPADIFGKGTPEPGPKFKNFNYAPSNRIINPPVPKFKLPGIGENIAAQHSVPGIAEKFKVPKVELPIDTAPKNPVSPEFSWGQGDSAMRILHDPAQMDAMNAAKRSDNAKRAAEVRWGRNPDNLDKVPAVPETPKEFSDRLFSYKMAKAGVVLDGKGRLSQPAIKEVIDNLHDGRLFSFKHDVPAAEGDFAQRAIQEAEQLKKSKLTAGPNNKRIDLNPANQANLYNRMYNATADLVKNHPDLVQKFGLNTGAIKLTENQKSLINDIRQSAAADAKRGQKWSAQDFKDELNTLKGNGHIAQKDYKALNKYIDNNFKEQAGSTVVKASSPRVLAFRKQLAREMLRTAEEHLASQGIHPVYWNGMKVNLSDILHHVGPGATNELPTRVLEAFAQKDVSKIQDPAVAEAIHMALGERSVDTGHILQTLDQSARAIKANVIDNVPYPDRLQIEKQMMDNVKEATNRYGMTATEQRAAYDHINTIVKADKTPAQDLLDRLHPETRSYMLKGKPDPNVVERVNKMIRYDLKDLGPAGGLRAVVNGAYTTFMDHTTTWYGRGEMKNFSDDVFQVAEANALARLKWLTEQSKGLKASELNEAFRIAQGRIPVNIASSPRVAQVAESFNNYFKQVLKESGFNKELDTFGSTAERAQIMMADLNKHMKHIGSKFEFVDKRVKDPWVAMGNKYRDFSGEGEGWLRSWSLANPGDFGQNPLKFIHDVDVAMQRVTAEYSLYDSFATHFGKKVGEEGYNVTHTVTVPHPRLHGYQFDPKTAEEFRRLIHDNEAKLWNTDSELFKIYQSSLRAWKAGVTKYFPSHHIRNLLGDTWLTWAAGHSNPANYTRAARTLKAYAHMYGEAVKSPEIAALEPLVSKDALQLAHSSETSQIINKRGVTMNIAEVYTAAHQLGLLPSASRLLDIVGEPPLKIATDKILKQGVSEDNAVINFMTKPFGGKVSGFAEKIAEHREHYVRLAHFIGAIEKRAGRKGFGNNIQKIIEDAAHEVRKWHPDGRDMTAFEQKWMRNIFPFYSWTRKVMPLLAQTAVQRPSRIMFMPRAIYAAQNAQGFNTTIRDPFPNDQPFPDWIRNIGIGPLVDPRNQGIMGKWWVNLTGRSNEATAFNGGPLGYIGINPNPIMGTVTDFTGGGVTGLASGALNSVTPLVKIPIELGKNSSFSGAPITGPGGSGVLPYLAQQVPGLTIPMSVARVGQKDRTASGIPNGPNIATLFNYLTAAGVRGTGRYIKSAEFEARARAKAAKDAAKKKAAGN